MPQEIPRYTAATELLFVTTLKRQNKYITFAISFEYDQLFPFRRGTRIISSRNEMLVIGRNGNGYVYGLIFNLFYTNF